MTGEKGNLRSQISSQILHSHILDSDSKVMFCRSKIDKMSTGATRGLQLQLTDSNLDNNRDIKHSTLQTLVQIWMLQPTWISRGRYTHISCSLHRVCSPQPYIFDNQLYTFTSRSECKIQSSHTMKWNLDSHLARMRQKFQTLIFEELSSTKQRLCNSSVGIYQCPHGHVLIEIDVQEKAHEEQTETWSRNQSCKIVVLMGPTKSRNLMLWSLRWRQMGLNWVERAPQFHLTWNQTSA